MIFTALLMLCHLSALIDALRVAAAEREGAPLLQQLQKTRGFFSNDFLSQLAREKLVSALIAMSLFLRLRCHADHSNRYFSTLSNRYKVKGYLNIFMLK